MTSWRPINSEEQSDTFTRRKTPRWSCGVVDDIDVERALAGDLDLLRDVMTTTGVGEGNADCSSGRRPVDFKAEERYQRWLAYLPSTRLITTQN